MDRPALYDAVQRAVGWPRAWRLFVARHLRPRPGMRILDIGCGTAELLSHLSTGSYLGLDPDAAHVAAARRRHRGRGRFRVGGVDVLGDGDGPFDAVLALGVLHHVDDAEAGRILAAARVHLAPAGRLLTLDACRAPGQRSVTRWLLDGDRGRFVRDEAGYRALVAPHFPRLRAERRDDLLRVPYSLLVIEGRPLA